MKNFIEILVLCASVLLVSCSKGDMPENSFDRGVNANLIVRGAVYDKETGEPVKGIRVTLSAYEEEDYRMETPTVIQSVYTPSTGLFDFNVETRGFLQFDLKVFDDGNVAYRERYESARIAIILSYDSPSFNHSTRTFIKEGNVFYLNTLSHR